MDYKSIKQSNAAASIGMPVIKLEGKHAEIEQFVSKRVSQMKEYRKNLGIEEEWKAAEIEYKPGSLDDGADKDKKRLVADDELGLRSHYIKLDADDEWRSRNSEPTLAVKVQTAISLIIDSDPEATLRALSKRFEGRIDLQKALWKRNWEISEAKDTYKKFVFNLATFGWAPGKVFPWRVTFDKEVLTEVDDSDYDEEGESKKKYDKKTNIWFNDITRTELDPFRTWMDEQTRPYKDFSTNDWYYEDDYSYDAAKAEFGHLPNFDKYIPGPIDLKVLDAQGENQSSSDEQKSERTDIITIGFYENRLKDLYVIRVPKLGVCLKYCPLPNDDGYLSLFHTPWLLRSARSPYGLSLWQMIKQKKGLYDKMQNMTMDQLVLSIMPMFFYTGTGSLIGDGKIRIQPGRGHHIMNGKVDFMDIPGPGKEAWEGLRFLKGGMDDDSGVTPTLSGELSDKNTLGEILHAKEGALKRMKTPLENIADAIEQDAYITMSWMKQVYSVPEVKTFATEEELARYEVENEVRASTKIAEGVDETTGELKGPFTGTFLPQLNLKLEKGSGNKLIESTTERFFQVGKDFEVDLMEWRGMFKVIPKSLVSSSEVIEQQQNLEVFNIIVPLLPQPAEIFAKPVKQLLTSRDQDPQNWLPDSWLQYLQSEGQKNNLFVQAPGAAPAGAVPGSENMSGASNQSSMQGAAGTTPGVEAPKVVPQQQFSAPQVPGVNSSPRNELTRLQ